VPSRCRGLDPELHVVFAERHRCIERKLRHALPKELSWSEPLETEVPRGSRISYFTSRFDGTAQPSLDDTRAVIFQFAGSPGR